MATIPDNNDLLPLPQSHFNNSKRLLTEISKDKIADWLLNEGYFPEHYVLPPCFKIGSFGLNIEPFHKDLTRFIHKCFEKLDEAIMFTLSSMPTGAILQG